MTDEPKRWGPPIIYPFLGMAVGDVVQLEAPTAADTKRLAKNASQTGQRHERFYRCRTDRVTRIMTVTRIR